MKHFILSVCCCSLLLFFSGCKKTADKSNEDISTAIIGRWKPVGISAGPAVHYAILEGFVLEFTNNENRTYRDGQLLQKWNYTIIEDSATAEAACWSVPSKERVYRIMYDNNMNNRQVIYMSDNKLFIMSGCFADNGHQTVYEKIK